MAKHPEPCRVPQQVPPNSWSHLPTTSAVPQAPHFPQGTPSAAGPCPATVRHRVTRGYADAESKANLPPSCIASPKKLNLSRNLLAITYSPRYILWRGRLRAGFSAHAAVPPSSTFVLSYWGQTGSNSSVQKTALLNMQNMYCNNQLVTAYETESSITRC